MFQKSSASPKCAHNKFSGEEGEIEDNERQGPRTKERKAVYSSPARKDLSGTEPSSKVKRGPQHTVEEWRMSL